MRRAALGLISATIACACTHGTVGPNGPTSGHAPRGVATATKAVKPVMKRFDSARDGGAVMLAERDGHVVAYIADEDDAIVRVVDVDETREIATIHPGGVPAQLVMLNDGRIVASLRDVSQLAILDGDEVVKRIDVPTEPIGLALSPDDSSLVVASGWGRTVSVLDAHTFEKKSAHAVSREPRTVVIAKDGSRAFVSHAVGQWVDVVPLSGLGPTRAIGVN